jgi:hypothetical protein
MYIYFLIKCAGKTHFMYVERKENTFLPSPKRHHSKVKLIIKPELTISKVT